MAKARGTAYVGCSGWQYKDWRRIVYPEGLPQRAWFDYYTTLFETVEVNNTFYRLPPPETVEGWAKQAPAGFVYALKLGQFGSHRMKLRDAQSWLPNHVDRADRLGAFLGPTLVQLPPRWRRNVERLEDFLSVAPGTMRWAVELRDPSWQHDDVYAVLASHNVALCHHDLLPEHPLVRTADWTYDRFHGPAALAQPYRGSYPRERLAALADRMAATLEAGQDVYAYFNNDWHGHAVADARWLKERLA